MLSQIIEYQIFFENHIFRLLNKVINSIIALISDQEKMMIILRFQQIILCLKEFIQVKCYLIGTNIIIITISAMLNDPNSFKNTNSVYLKPDSPSKSPQRNMSNGAPLKGQKVNADQREGFKQNFMSENTLFSTLLRESRLQGGKKIVRIQSGGNEQLWNLIKKSLDQFSRNFSVEKYAQLSNKPHLGLTAEQMGFSKGAKLENSAQLSNFWKKILDFSATQLQTNKIACLKALCKYITRQGVLKNFYELPPDGLNFKPIQDRINALMIPGTKEVNTQGEQFVIVVAQVSEAYFEEYNSCIYYLSQILDPQYCKFKSNEKYIGKKAIWDAYCEVSRNIFKPQLVSKNKIYTAMRQEIRKKQLKLLLNIIKFLYSFISQISQDQDQLSPLHRNQKQLQFGESLLKRLNEDICSFEKMESRSVISPDAFSRLLINLILITFPFQIFHKSQKSPQAPKQFILSALNTCQSPHLRLIVTLFKSFGKNQRNEKGQKFQFDQQVINFEKIVRQGEWNAFETNWKEWLGIFLQKFKSQFKRFPPQLSNRVISLCKEIVAQEGANFWKQESDKPYYMTQIQQFLNLAKQEDFEGSHYVKLLPICTKLLGSISKNQNYSDKIIEFLSQDCLASIFSTVIFSFKIQNQRNGRSERLIYRSRQEDGLQQEVKFICRLIQLNPHRLDRLYKIFLQDIQEGERKGGVLLIVRLLQIFYAVPAESSSNLKCLRYMMRAFSAIFVYRQSRSEFCVALSVLQKQDYTKSLRSIVTACFNYNSLTQQGRQSQKLRLAIGYHLNTIIRVSDTLEQYFPTASPRDCNHFYRRMQQNLQHEEIQQFNKKAEQARKKGQFRAVQWFYELVKLFESHRLNAIDLDTIRQLLLKMRVKSEDSREFANLSVIVDILNNGVIESVLLEALAPVACNKSSNSNHFLGLANKKFEGFMAASSLADYLRMEKYSNMAYRFCKQKYKYNLDKNQLYSQLSGFLAIIETILRLNIQDEYSLLKKLKLASFINAALFSENPHCYQIRITARVDKASENISLNRLKSELIEEEFEGSATLLHSIASLWNFQDRMKINQNQHPTSSFKLRGYLSPDFKLPGQRFEANRLIFYHSQQSLLADFTRGPETAGVNSIAKIFQYIIVLGQGKTLYYSLISRNYPLSKGTVKAASQLLTEFFFGLLSALRSSVDPRDRKDIMQLLCTMMHEPHFSVHIRNKIFQFKEALGKCRQIQQPHGSLLAAQFLLFLNLLLSDGSEISLRFTKSCIGDLVEFAKSLIENPRLKSNRLKSSVTNQPNSKYLTFEWSAKAREVAAAKLSLLYFLGIASHLICSEGSSLSTSLTSILLTNSEIFLEFSEIEEDLSNQILLSFNINSPQLQETNQYCFMKFDQSLLFKMLFNLPYSLGGHFMIKPWQVLEKCETEKPWQVLDKCETDKLVLFTHRLNSGCSLHYTEQMLSQFYCLLVRSILQRRQSGAFFITLNPQYNQQIPFQLLLSKQQAKNHLSGQDLLSATDGYLLCCLRLCKRIENSIWEQKKGFFDFPKDVAYATLGQLFQVIERNIANQLSLLPECNRLIDKVISYLSNSNRFTFTVHAKVLVNLLKLASKVLCLESAKSKGRNPLNLYFGRFHECLKSLFSSSKLQFLQKQTEDHQFALILSCLILCDIQGQNISYFESCSQIFSYFENTTRLDMLATWIQISRQVVGLLNFSLSTKVTTSLLQLCSRLLIVNFLSKSTKAETFPQNIVEQILLSVENLQKKISSEDSQIRSCIHRLVIDMVALGESEARRRAEKIFINQSQYLSKQCKRIGEIKILSQAIYMNSLLAALAYFASEESSWRNEQMKGVLDLAFLTIMEKPIHFDPNLMTPQSICEKELSKSFQRRRANGLSSAYSLYAWLLIYQQIKYFLLFISFSLQYSPSLRDFCNNTFNCGSINESNLQKLSQSLIEAIFFFSELFKFLKNSKQEEILAILHFSGSDPELLNKSNLDLLFLQKFKNRDELLQDLSDTLQICASATSKICLVSKSFCWKSTNDWEIYRQKILGEFCRTVEVGQQYFFDQKVSILQERASKLLDRANLNTLLR